MVLKCILSVKSVRNFMQKFKNQHI